jgi:hypothetical protein
MKRFVPAGFCHACPVIEAEKLKSAIWTGDSEQAAVRRGCRSTHLPLLSADPETDSPVTGPADFDRTVTP